MERIKIKIRRQSAAQPQNAAPYQLSLQKKLKQDQKYVQKCFKQDESLSINKSYQSQHSEYKYEPISYSNIHRKSQLRESPEPDQENKQPNKPKKI